MIRVFVFTILGLILGLTGCVIGLSSTEGSVFYLVGNLYIIASNFIRED